MATPTPPESLVQYGDPIFTGESMDPSRKHGSAETTPKLDSIAKIEDVLNAMLPPQ